MQYENMKNIPVDTLSKFNEEIGRYLDGLCAKFETSGYNYFYEVSENDLQEWAEANNYKFFKDGQVA